jgi:hypothetical protein
VLDDAECLRLIAAARGRSEADAIRH